MVQNTVNTGNKFRFKSLKVHNTNDWILGNRKKYRQVFDAATTRYMYVELAINNLEFNSADWKITVNFKAFDQSNKLLCDNKVEQTISADTDIAYIRYSWGKPEPGAYWTKGNYRWEAWVDGVILSSAYFYTVNEGEVTAESNPYFSLTSIKLYESPFETVPFGERNYLKTFNYLTTRYMWVEIEGDNLQHNKVPWMGEFIIRIRDSSGDSIAEIYDLYNYNNTISKVRFMRGWGSKEPGSWYEGGYVVEVSLLEKVLGTVYVNFSNEEVTDPDAGKFFLPGEGMASSSLKTETLPDKELSEAEIMAEINEMIGLATIKKDIDDLYDYLKFVKLRQTKGFDDKEKMNLHAVFTGNPGTGKTKVALMLGKIYRNLGILSKGHVHEVDRADLIGEFIGQTGPKVKEAIKKARGGILFIDEAYALARKGDTEKDYGKEVIEIILKEMSDGKGDLAIIVAGYPDEMQYFIGSNPGLRSRFTRFFHFPDYTPSELLQIGNYYASKTDVDMDKDAEEYLYTKLVEAYRDRDKTFGNARYVNSIVDEAKMNMGLRVMNESTNIESLDNTALSTITTEDIKEIFQSKQISNVDIPPDEELMRDSLAELNKLIGLNELKADVHEMVKLVRYFRETGKDVTRSFSLHTVFTGNPGTGKTTVARILARIFRALGVLERGHLVEVDREELVAGYIGQTAIKTAEKIDAAMGGVLFIDEAYSLMGSSENDFGKEAIEIILKRMEDNRGKFVVICAGYTGEMENFLKMNPGLKSRFDRKFDFPDYSEDELFSIAKIILAEQELEFDGGAAEHFRKHIASLYSGRDKYFGNARDIRKSISEAVKNQNLRLAEITKDKRTAEMIRTVTIDDVSELDTVIKEEKRMGF
ncbi:MAG: AAA family ATPase [Ignavibacteria bacterium]|nr:AAA family ATPase [Ignavibacteria bacterium]